MKIIAGYCLFGYVIVVVLFLSLWCRPFSQYWAVPVEVCKSSFSLTHCSDEPVDGQFTLCTLQLYSLAADDYTAQCATYYHHLIFATTWNISADLALLAIPFLIIPQSQLPLQRKILVTCVLGLGVLNVSVQHFTRLVISLNERQN